MYKVIACNKSLCHLTTLQPYTKILEQPTKRRPTKPTRLNLKEPMYMDMASSLVNHSILFTNPIIEGSRCNLNKSCPVKLRDSLSMKVVEEHIQMVMRLLATQFENERQDKDFDSNIRLIQHAQEIKKIFQRRTFDLKAHLQKLMKTKTSTLPVTEDEMRELEDRLLHQKYSAHSCCWLLAAQNC